MSRINSPTLVLWGNGDRLLPPAVGADLAQEIHGAWFLTLPDTGHVPQEETPTEFARAVADFLRSRLSPPRLDQ
jgi:pimeloyl-ACP methyl ester carboxylesterase